MEADPSNLDDLDDVQLLSLKKRLLARCSEREAKVRKLEAHKENRDKYEDSMGLEPLVDKWRTCCQEVVHKLMVS